MVGENRLPFGRRFFPFSQGLGALDALVGSVDTSTLPTGAEAACGAVTVVDASPVIWAVATWCHLAVWGCLSRLGLLLSSVHGPFGGLGGRTHPLPSIGCQLILPVQSLLHLDRLEAFGGPFFDMHLKTTSRLKEVA